MIGGLLTKFAACAWMRAALRHGAIELALLLLALRRSLESVADVWAHRS